MAFDTAVSGLKAAGTNLDIIGNNISNAGTAGFKSSRGEFADVYASGLLGSSANAVGQGVAIQGVSQAFTQGNISFTDNTLDFAINGGGFFILEDSGSSVYSRAGNFQVDRTGFVVNPAGARLQVFNTTAAGELSGGTSDLEIDTSLIQPSATANVEVVANLDSRSSIITGANTWATASTAAGGFDGLAAASTAPGSDNFTSSTAVTFFDSLGNSHVLSLYFERTTPSGADSEWNVHGLIDGQELAAAPSVSITFDSSGALNSANTTFDVTSFIPQDPNSSPGVANGAAAQTFSVDLSSITQFGADFSTTRVEQDGFTTGQLSGIEVGDAGVVFARFTNGQSRALGQVALASFTNTSGLVPLGGNVWAESFSSGQPVFSAPGTGGLGIVQSGALEESNVEVSEQLVDMIITQRNFQANAKVIQTADTITQTVINLR